MRYLHLRAAVRINALALLLTITAGCNQSDTYKANSPQKSSTAQQSKPQIRFHPKHKVVEITAEVARFREEISRGLMYRRSMPQDHGILFVMGKEQIQSFWMRNTYIPLDMIFVDKHKIIVGIIENTKPLSETPQQVDKASSYVIEVNAGFAAKHRIAAEDSVSFVNINDTPAGY